QAAIGFDEDAKQLVGDLFAALLGGEDDVVVAQPLLVIAGGDGDLASAQTAMSGGQSAGAHTGQLERDDLFTKQSDDPANRANKPRAALAGPIHGLREIQLEDDAGQAVREDVTREAAGDFLCENVILALGAGFGGQVLGLDALLAR